MSQLAADCYYLNSSGIEAELLHSLGRDLDWLGYVDGRLVDAVCVCVWVCGCGCGYEHHAGNF